MQLLLRADEPYGSARVAMVRALHKFARTINKSFVILTGSSADLRTRLLKYGPESEVQRFRAYHKFNNSLCTFYHVGALRTVESLKSYLKVRYPTRQFDDADVRRLLHETGGICRLVHAIVGCSQADGKKRPTLRRLTPELVNSPANGFVVAVHIIRIAQGEALSAALSGPAPVYLVPDQVSVPLYGLVSKLCCPLSITRDESKRRICEWIDGGLLYATSACDLVTDVTQDILSLRGPSTRGRTTTHPCRQRTLLHSDSRLR
eukprot:Opistho-2@75315